jgi:anti-anti-sigma factor
MATSSDATPQAAPPSPLAEFSCGEQDNVHTVAVAGELDISNVTELRAAAMKIPNRALGLVVDLSEVSFIDSSTVGLLFELRHSLERRTQALRVVCRPSTPPERALEIMSFDERLLGERTTSDAVAAIRREVPLAG